MNIRKNRGQTKPWEPEEDKRKKARLCNREAGPCS